MLVMNALHYDAMAVAVITIQLRFESAREARGEAQFPWLSGKPPMTRAPTDAFPGLLIKEIAGVRIGSLACDSGNPNWDNAQNTRTSFVNRRGSREVGCSVARAEKVDIVVIAMHMGLEADLNTGEINPGQAPNENLALRSPDKCPHKSYSWSARTATCLHYY